MAAGPTLSNGEGTGPAYQALFGRALI